jgi:molecular chaperone DnaJ
MAAVKSDYYEVLGVRRDADAETIRTAFHARARDCHPDVSDSPEDHRRFRELAEAYGVLSKPASRLLYDRYGYRGRGNQGFDDKLWESRDRPPRGENVHGRIEIRAYEAEGGTRRLVRYEAPAPCGTCEGSGVIGEADPKCAVCGGTGQQRQVSHLDVARILRIETCPECGVDPCDECEGTGVVEAERRLRVRIPPGVEDGAQVRVAGEGGAGGPGGVPGDLFFDIDVSPEPRDRPFVRWLALAGMLAAVALLVAYLLLR